MQDETKLSITYMESNTYSFNLTPKNPLKIILKRKDQNWQIRRSQGKKDNIKGGILINF